MDCHVHAYGAMVSMPCSPYMGRTGTCLNRPVDPSSPHQGAPGWDYPPAGAQVSLPRTDSMKPLICPQVAREPRKEKSPQETSALLTEVFPALRESTEHT